MPNFGAWSRTTARRAEAQAIVTRMGQDRASGLGSPQGRLGGEPFGARWKRRIERGADKACAPMRLPVNRPIPIRENAEPERRTLWTHNAELLYRGGRKRAGCGDAWDAATPHAMRRAVAAPPVPCWQRGTACLHRVKGVAPGEAGRQAALDPAAVEVNANGSGTTDDENALGCVDAHHAHPTGGTTDQVARAGEAG